MEQPLDNTCPENFPYSDELQRDIEDFYDIYKDSLGSQEDYGDNQ